MNPHPPLLLAVVVMPTPRMIWAMAIKRGSLLLIPRQTHWWAWTAATQKILYIPSAPRNPSEIPPTIPIITGGGKRG